MAEASQPIEAKLRNEFSHSTLNNSGSNFIGNSLNTGGGPINFNLRPASNNAQAQEVLRRLKLRDPRVDRIDIQLAKDELLDDTCRWVCEDVAFKTWIESKDGQWPIMWLHGDAGKGKTMMMVALADEIRNRLETGEKMAFYFCQSGSNLHNNAVAILRGLLYLLASDDTQVLFEVQDAYGQSGEALFEGPHALVSLWTLLTKAVTRRTESVYLLVDALDECSEQIDELLKLITRTDTSRKRPIKWLVSSRNDHQVGRYLVDSPRIQHTSLELNADRVDSAINQYVDIKCHELQKLQGCDSKTIDTIRHYLADNADGTFLWVSLVYKMLADSNMKSWKMLEELENTPAGLEPFYDRMLNTILERESIEDANLCKSVLRAIYLAVRPLQIEEIRLVACLDPMIFSDTSNVRSLLRACGSFLTISAGTISFVHKSAADYFETGPGKAIFSSTLALAHAQIAVSCCDQMNDKLYQNMGDLTHPTDGASSVSEERRRIISNQLSYANHEWIVHLEKFAYHATTSEEQQILNIACGSSLRIFFEQKFLFYVECFCIWGEVSNAARSLHRASKVFDAVLDQLGPKVESSVASADTLAINGYVDDMALIRNILGDYQQFMQRFTTAFARFPMHIYASALSMCPSNSYVWKRFESLCPGWLKGKPNIGIYWNGVTLPSGRATQIAKCLSFSSNVDWLAAGYEAGLVHVWDARTGSLHWETHLNGSRSVTAISFSPDCSLMFANSPSSLQVWRVADGLLRLDHSGGNLDQRTAPQAFSSDSTKLAHLSLDGTICIWNTNDFEKIAFVQNLGSAWKVEALSWSQGEAAFVACSSLADKVRVWQVGTQRTILERLLPYDSGNSRFGSIKLAVFAPHTDFILLVLARVKDRGSAIFSLNTREDRLQEISRHETSEIIEFGLSAGEFIASGLNVIFKDLKTDRIIGEADFRFEKARFSLLDTQDTRAVFLAADAVVVFDTTNGRAVHMIDGVGQGITTCSISKDGSLVASAYRNQLIRMWNTTDFIPPQRPIESGEELHTLTFEGKGSKVVSLAVDNSTSIRLRNGRTFRHFSQPRRIPGCPIVFSPDGKYIAQIDERYSKVRVRDVVTSSIVEEMDIYAPDTGVHLDRERSALSYDGGRPMAFSPQGRKFACVSGFETLTLWTLSYGSEAIARTPKSISRHRSATLDFSETGTYLAFVSDVEVQLYRTHEMELVWQKTLSEPQRPLLVRIIFSEDDSTLAVSMESLYEKPTNKTLDVIYAWDTRTGAVRANTIKRPHRHDRKSQGDFALDQSGTNLAYVDVRGKIIIRNLKTQQTTTILHSASRYYQRGSLKYVLGLHRSTTTSDLSSGQYRLFLSLSSDRDWIEHNGLPFFWLPPDMRGEHIAIHEESVAMTDKMGAVRVYHFDLNKLPNP